jgi:hypothetical protein
MFVLLRLKIIQRIDEEVGVCLKDSLILFKHFVIVVVFEVYPHGIHKVFNGHRLVELEQVL